MAPDRYDERWRETRWERPPPVDEDKEDHGTLLVESIRGLGGIPSFLQVGFRSSASSPWNWDHEWALTFEVVRELRSRLPADAFPFAIFCGSAQFVSGEVNDERQLLSLAESLHEAFLVDPRLSEPGLEVNACWIDDGRPFKDMRVFTSLGVSSDLSPPPVFVVPARHLAPRPGREGLWSPQGFVERVLPRRRVLSTDPPTLVGVKPVGPVWEALGDGHRYDVGSQVVWSLVRLAAERRQYLLETKSEFAAAALLPSTSAVAAYERMVDDLRTHRRYFRRVDYGYEEPALEAGVLEISSEQIRVPIGSDGVEELERLRTALS